MTGAQNGRIILSATNSSFLGRKPPMPEAFSPAAVALSVLSDSLLRKGSTFHFDGSEV